MTRHRSSQEPPLPVSPRPRQGETADSYLRRLATANHLRFTYLRRYVATPKGSYGPVDPGQLATLAGREPRAILRAFPELAQAAPGPGARRDPREESRRHQAKAARREREAATREKYAAIRRDAENGLTQRAIISKRHVGRRTITLALASAEPPERKKIHREPEALSGLHPHIDAMLDEDPAIRTATIWQRLADDHAATVAYPTLRAYVSNRRTLRATKGDQAERPGSARDKVPS